MSKTSPLDTLKMCHFLQKHVPFNWNTHHLLVFSPPSINHSNPRNFPQRCLNYVFFLMRKFSYIGEEWHSFTHWASKSRAHTQNLDGDAACSGRSELRTPCPCVCWPQGSPDSYQRDVVALCRGSAFLSL